MKNKIFYLIAAFLCFTTIAQAEITKKDKVEYYTGSFGFLAEPAKAGKYPALVMIHEWWGLSADIKEIAQHYASLGYVVLAVDLYGGKATDKPEEAKELAGKVGSDTNAAFDNLKAAVAYLKNNSKVDINRIGSIGWCFGGGWSLKMATNNLGVKASVVYYGALVPENDLQMMKADIIGHFADKDMNIKVDDVKSFQAALKTMSGHHEIYIYPNTTHGFASREKTNPNYNKKEATIANQRTLAFLKKHL